MSGHSKWSTIKHRKGAADAKRAKLFSKVIKEISVAARLGGKNPDFNSRLRTAVAWAKSVNMPGSNIQNAIKKGTENSDENYETFFYEGYGPGNTAVIIECLSDNKNRTATSIRTCFNKNNASLGSSNSVKYMFNSLGIFKIPKSFKSEEELLELLLESPAKDINAYDEENYVVSVDSDDFGKMQTFLDENSIPTNGSELTFEAENKEVVDDFEEAQKVIKFLEMLENDDDVQKVYSNFEISDQVKEALEKAES